MNFEIAKHSHQEAFGTIKSQVAVWVDGSYTRVFAIETDSPVVKMNTTGTRTKKVTGKKAAAIVEFARNNIEAAK